MRPSIGKNVRLARKARGLTQRELGALLGVTRLTVLRIENEQSQPRIDMLVKLARVLRKPVSALVA